MSYTNSPLVSYTKISPNKTINRKYPIDTITIHCVAGQLSVETIGQVFAPASRQASSNYGVGYDGKIGMYVEEKDRSWCTSSAANDHRAVTIEVASDTKSPYAVNEAAYESLIKLVADICKRNNIKQLLWKGDKSLIGQIDKQNMTVHCWYANKACPGDYLYQRHPDIARRVNALLSAGDEPIIEKPVTVNTNTSNTNDFKKNDVVKITGDRYYTGKAVPAWVKNKSWIVSSVSGNQVIVGKSTDGTNNINSPFNSADLTLVSRQGVVTTPSTASDSSMSFAVNDVIYFGGTKQYKSSTGSSYVPAKASRVKVTAISPKTAHPYHVRSVNDNDQFISGVYGWVSALDVAPFTPTVKSKSIETLAREVIAGLWNTGATRKKLLEDAGYNYSQVQSAVNKMLKS